MDPVRVACLGLACPVGLTPESAAAAMRAGVARFTDLPYLDRTGEPVVGAVVPGLASELRAKARMAELIVRAFHTVGGRLPRPLVARELPLLLCLREPERPGVALTGLVDEICARLDLLPRNVRQVALGPVAAFTAMAHAREELADGRIPACLIAAVDTSIAPRTLQWLARAKRLRSDAQSDGIVPGEAACVALVSRRAWTPSSLSIRGLGFAVETATVLDDEPLLGKGMTAAVRAALDAAGVPMHAVDFRLSDVAGESYAFEELVLAQTRLARQTRASQDLWHPAEFIGDCGAVAGLIQLAWAEQAFARGYAPGPVALLHGSAPAGARAAAVVGA